MLEENLKIQLSLRVSWKRKKNEFGDTILIVKIHKRRFCLRIEDRERNSKNYNQYLVDYFKSNSAKYYGKIILEANGLSREIDITEESEMDPKKDSFN